MVRIDEVTGAVGGGGAARLGLCRVVALYYRSSTSYRIF
jgi:hypothetical protein